MVLLFREAKDSFRDTGKEIGCREGEGKGTAGGAVLGAAESDEDEVWSRAPGYAAEFVGFMRIHMRGLLLWGVLSGEVPCPPCPVAPVGPVPSALPVACMFLQMW